MRKVAEIRIESLTPSAIGGYDPNKHDDILRGTSIRGLAAWWLRAIVSGKAYDGGDLQYREKAINVQKEVFGSTDKSSLLTVVQEVQSMKGINPSFLKRNGGIDHIRLKLLLMGKKDKDTLLKKMLRIFRGTVKVYSSAKLESHMDAAMLGLHAIVLSLLSEGIGKGSRRGLGAVKVSQVTLPDEVRRFLQSNGYNGLLSLGQDSEVVLKNVIDDALKLAGKALKEASGKRSGRSLPEIPSLSMRTAEVYVKKMNLGGTPEERLIRLNTTLKKLFLRSMAPSGSLPDILQKTKPCQKKTKKGKIIRVSEATALGSYILGLPRAASSPPTSHEYMVKFRTGNTQSCSTSRVKLSRSTKNQYSGFIGFRNGAYEHYRRASPLIVSLLDERTIVVSFFKSSDWQDELQWFTSHQKTVTAQSVTDAYNIVSNYLRHNFIKVWP